MLINFPQFNEKQTDKLSDICSGIGFIFLTTVAIPAVLDKDNFNMLLLGGIGTMSFFIVSVWLKK